MYKAFTKAKHKRVDGLFHVVTKLSVKIANKLTLAKLFSLANGPRGYHEYY